MKTCEGNFKNLYICTFVCLFVCLFFFFFFLVVTLIYSNSIFIKFFNNYHKKIPRTVIVYEALNM